MFCSDANEQKNGRKHAPMLVTAGRLVTGVVLEKR